MSVLNKKDVTELKEMLDFCFKHNVELTITDTFNPIKHNIIRRMYQRKDLSDEEIKLFKSIDIMYKIDYDEQGDKEKIYQQAKIEKLVLCSQCTSNYVRKEKGD